jgi:NAD(P)-dependent dehydrogenase (short-subunit alcohol dehydrogenase family)
LLTEERATVIIADMNLPRAQKLAEELGRPAEAREVEITSPESVNTLIQNCLAGYGAIHLLINSAGIMVHGDAQDFSNAEWSSVLNVNLQGSVTATMAAYRVMAKQGFGHIVNLASLSGLNAPPFFLPYVTSKYAVVGMSIALRAEAEPHGVKVSVVCPGNVATPLTSAALHRPSRLTPTVSPQRAAREILHGICLNKSIIVFPAYARMFWRLERAAPWLSSMLRGLIVKNASVQAGSSTPLPVFK